MKLKTLKDLTITKHGVPNSNTARTDLYSILQVGKINDYCFPNQLRQEAIKWIKEIDKNEMSNEFAVMYGIKPIQLAMLNRLWKLERKFTIGWIKHFFNITEEDLK